MQALIGGLSSKIGFKDEYIIIGPNKRQRIATAIHKLANLIYH